MAYTPGSAADYDQNRWSADAVRAEANAEGTLEAQRAQEAETGEVKDARFIGYAEVLDVYNRRSDTEPLADRRARHLAADPADQDFTRRADWTGNSTTQQTPDEPRGTWTPPAEEEEEAPLDPENP